MEKVGGTASGTDPVFGLGLQHENGKSVVAAREGCRQTDRTGSDHDKRMLTTTHASPPGFRQSPWRFRRRLFPFGADSQAHSISLSIGE